MRGIILEGIPGSGKTAVFRHLHRLLSDGDCPSLFLSESCTERTLEPLNKSTVRKSLGALNTVLNFILHFKNLSCKSNGNVIKRYILERFHLSHCLDIAGKDFFYEYTSIDRRLGEFNATVVVFTMDVNVIEQRSVIRTKQNRPAAWSKYLSSLGNTDTEIARYYIQQQENFLFLCSQSGLPHIQIDTTNENWPEAANTILQTLHKP